MGTKAGEIIARFGGQSALARSLGVNQSTVQHWAKTGQIPSWRREQVLRAAQARRIPLQPADLGVRPAGALGAPGPAMGFGHGLTEAAPAPQPPPVSPPAQVAVPHGRAEFIPNVEWELGQLRGEIGQLRTLLEKLVDEVAALRGASEEPGPPRQERSGKSKSSS